MNKFIHEKCNTTKRLLKAPFMIKHYAMLGERLLLRKQYKCSAPQLFITGLPKSGTTLIYQYIAHRLNVSYFTHAVGNFPHAPCLCTLMQHKIHGQYQSNFKNVQIKCTTSQINTYLKVLNLVL